VVKQTWPNIYLNGAKYRTVMSPFCWGNLCSRRVDLIVGPGEFWRVSRPLIDGEIAAIFLRQHLGGKF
jgi:hypothetical protein